MIGGGGVMRLFPWNVGRCNSLDACAFTASDNPIYCLATEANWYKKFVCNVFTR